MNLSLRRRGAGLTPSRAGVSAPSAQTDFFTGGTSLPRCSPLGTLPKSTDPRRPASKRGSYSLCCTSCLSFVSFLSAQTISSLDSKRRSHVRTLRVQSSGDGCHQICKLAHCHLFDQRSYGRER